MTRKILFLLGAAVLCLAACQKPELTLSGPSNLESAVSGVPLPSADTCLAHANLRLVFAIEFVRGFCYNNGAVFGIL